MGANNRIVYYNPAFQTIWQLPKNLSLHSMYPAEAINHAGTNLADADQLGAWMRAPTGPQDDRPISQVSLTDGRVVTRLSHAVYDSNNTFLGHLWMFEDVTQEQQTAQQLIYLAERDSLTGLFNRHRLHEEMGRLLAESERSGTHGALLFFDLDEFKFINDKIGRAHV